MAEEAKLPLKHSIERALEIRDLLLQLDAISDQHKSDVKSKGKTKSFVIPSEDEVHKTRWKKYCTSTTRQLYGLNQKVSSFILVSLD